MRLAISLLPLLALGCNPEESGVETDEPIEDGVVDEPGGDIDDGEVDIRRVLGRGSLELRRSGADISADAKDLMQYALMGHGVSPRRLP